MGGNVAALRDKFQQKQNDLIKGDVRVKTGLASTKASRERLSTAQLKGAGCDSSKNPVVQSLWAAVKDYDENWHHPTTMTDQQVYHAVATLDFIYQTCATYMTDKSMKTLNSKGGPAKRHARYQAFNVLLGEVASEMESLGGKVLVGPTNFQQNKRNYWLERLDPHHRAGYKISGQYNTWVSSGSGQSFWDWLQANGGDALKAQTKVAGYQNPDGAQWDRCRYFDGGVLYNAENDMPFSTDTMRTEFSEHGWAVFVCSLPMSDPTGNIGTFVFSYTHKAGYDHHSSFLGGAPVLAAGEWIVDNAGRVRVITGKSGHYMPKWQNLHKFVCKFPDIPSNAIIRPNMLDHANGTDTIKYYLVSDFRSRELRATPLRRNVVLSAIMATGANKDIDEHTAAGIKSLTSLLPA